MDALRRISTLRRVATTASLAALLLVPATADAARGHKSQKPKSPVITDVSPLRAMVGQTLTIRGRNFRKGKGRNSVGFKRDGAAVVFIKSDVSTTKVMYVKISSKLEKVLYGGAAAQFHLRVLARRFGKQYTADKLSPFIKPRPEDVNAGEGGPTGATGPSGPTGSTGTGGDKPQFNPAGPDGDCDGDGVLNKNEGGDIDNDLLTDALENKIGTDGCDADSDNDGVLDSYEYKSAVDLNDDEYQQPNTALPYPGARPYPNPLKADATQDYDGDVLTLNEEYELWSKGGGRTDNETPSEFAERHLSYSDGLQYSAYENCPSSGNSAACGAGDGNRRVPTLKADGYAKQQDFLTWAGANGYATISLLATGEPWWAHVARGPYDIRDVNLDGSVSDGCGGQLRERLYYDFDCDGFLSDDERDEDADGLTNYDEAHGRMLPAYWNGCYAAEAPYHVVYDGTSLTNADSDGDGVRDGADDQDHDDLPNLMELSRFASSVGQAPVTQGNPMGYYNDTKGSICTPAEGLTPDAPNHPDAYGKVQPFDPCDPITNSRTCDKHPELGLTPDPDWWALQ
jgi:hypothetical protein